MATAFKRVSPRFASSQSRQLRQRGLTGVRLVVSDAHEGLKAAIAKFLPAARWQRCKVHFLRCQSKCHLVFGKP